MVRFRPKAASHHSHAVHPMQVKIVDFPETKVAVAEHRGPPEFEYEVSRKLIGWRIQNGVPLGASQTFGIHYTDPSSVTPEDHRVDFCVSYDRAVEGNPQNIVSKAIPANKCALARHLGSRSHNTAALYLFRDWLPNSGFTVADFPVFFHYVNVGPDVHEADMITDVYLPIRDAV
jgi:AraC family transcriptional regulator